ncbi:TonB-dependent receptor [Luteimonas aestuarii]|uniref:TonB-dependent receptor n=1 Tax=Luteimonas aestuarii TaxID=453837 RepID=A0A4R5TTX5_9GAMM|nr:TonB-dependent receptor [Luteimonas aestuarii]TDK24460.1 TonB-dependent receptor [Luteimonas aestuarii]
MTNLKKLPGAIKLALFVGAASVVPASAVAQDAEPAENTSAATLDRVQVTGSRIKRAEIEGALPVTVITREAIEVSGKTTVADLLQNSTFNSFGSNKPASGSSAQSMSELSLRGLGGGRSLILIDGRRLPLSPQFSEAGSDLNSIPLAAVERVEILTDGASAIYGADAIGGVVNIITRKDFNGVEATVGIGNAQYGGDTESGSVVAGIAGERGRMLGGVSYANRDISYIRNLPWMQGRRGPSSNANNYYVPAVNPINGNVSPGKFISSVPGGCDNPGFWQDGAVCRYDYNLVAADTASLEQKSLFLRGDYQITDDWSVYLNSSLTRVSSFGRFAPTLADTGIFIPAASPNNTTGQDVVLKHRFAAIGPRDNFDDTDTYDTTLGFNWQATDSVAVDFGIRRAESKFQSLGRNYVNIPIATALIQSGQYNIFDPLGNPESVLGAVRATTGRDSFFKEDEIYAIGTFDLFELSGGLSGLVVGAEHHKQDFADIYDSQSEAGNIGGSSGNSSSGSRDYTSAYFEWLLPFTSQFEVNVAARYDSYSDFGDSFVPKISLRYQPLDRLTLRASYGEGFRAPPLTILNSKDAFSADSVVDADTAIAYGQPPGSTLQIDGLRVATPDLEPEDSKQWSAGVVWDPTDWLSLKLDYYNIELTNSIRFFSAQTVINRERNGTFLPASLYTVRDPVTNALLQVRAGYANEGFIETDGFDFSAVTRLDLGAYGSLRNNLQVSWINKFETGGPNSDTTDFINTTDTPQWRATLLNEWEKGNFSLAWAINAMDQTVSYTEDYLVNDLGYTCQDIVDFGYLSTNCGNDKAYITHDVSVSYKAPWEGRFTIGAINVTGKEPRLDQFGFTPPYYNSSLYYGIGREVYFRYTQNW